MFLPIFDTASLAFFFRDICRDEKSAAGMADFVVIDEGFRD